jgi:hypothetical protein
MGFNYLHAVQIVLFRFLLIDGGIICCNINVGYNEVLSLEASQFEQVDFGFEKLVL